MHKEHTEGDIKVLFYRLPGNDDLNLPQYMSSQAAGMDLAAAVEGECTIAPHKRVLIPTGFAVQLPSGFEAQIRPRSGLALQKGLTVLNSPGTIDADYRGEIKVILVNMDSASQMIRRGERIAQMVISRVIKAAVVEVDELEATRRGSNGFGSTDDRR